MFEYAHKDTEYTDATHMCTFFYMPIIEIKIMWIYIKNICIQICIFLHKSAKDFKNNCDSALEGGDL